MRRLRGHTCIGVLALADGDLALFEEGNRRRRGVTALPPRGYFPPPPQRVVMHYRATPGPGTHVPNATDLQRIVNAEADILARIAPAGELFANIIACIAGIGFVVPGTTRTFAPYFYRYGPGPASDGPALQTGVLRFACWQPNFFEDLPPTCVAVSFRPLVWQITHTPPMLR